MDRAQVLSRIDKVAESLLLCHPSELNVLAQIHTDLGDIAAWASSENLSQAAQTLNATANLIEKVILAEVSDTHAALDAIAQDIAAFQSLLRNGQLPAASEVEPIEQLRTSFTAYDTSPRTSSLSALRRALDAVQREAESKGSNDIAVIAGAASDAIGRVKDEMPQALRGAIEWLLSSKRAPSEVDALIVALARVGEPEPSALPAPFEVDDDLLRDFIAEALEHLHNADVHVLAIEANPQDTDAINAVFRAFHTIKGVAGFLSLSEVQSLAHETEYVLDRARKGELMLTGSYVDLVFEAVDTMERLIQNVEKALPTHAAPEPEPTLPDLLRRLKDVASGTLAPMEGELLDVSEPGKRIGDILIESGLARRTAVQQALEQQQKPEPELLGEKLVSEIVITRGQLEEALEIQSREGGARKLGEILVAMGAATWEDIHRVIATQDAPGERLGTMLVRSGEVSAKFVAQALRVQQSNATTAEGLETLRVDAERLDKLIDLIGELVIAQAMISRSLHQNETQEQLSRQLNQLDKTTRDLQAMGTSLRMMPIRGTFQKMSRLVRDLAKRTGKNVEFVTEGEETELDKSVIDRIGDPLVHMVRNAIDHGLETADERKATGKAETGRVTLRAMHKGGNVRIEIEDDGRGLDPEVVLAKAKERGLVRNGEVLSEREIFSLIFEPGFTTANEVTDISGRGVGMDVVRRNIEALRGHIEIQSERGKGTLFSIRLPLTMSIIDGMLVRVGAERYIVPTLSIVRSIKPEAENLSTITDTGELFVLQDEMLPLFRLYSLFGIADAEKNPLNGIVLILESESKRVGLLVDELLGQQQIVIKPLGAAMSRIAGIAGASILPDGRVGLIIDVGGILRLIDGGTSFTTAA